MKRMALLVVSALTVAACAGAGPSPGASATPSGSSPTAGSPTTGPTTAPTPSPRPTPTPVPPAMTCPPAMELSVRDFVDAEMACFTGVELTIRAWLDYSPPLGWEGPGIEPSWLAYPAGGGPAALWQAPPTGEDNVCDSEALLDCAWFFAHIDPATRLVLGARRWIVVTGHVADPASETCHYVPYDGIEEPLPDAAEAVSICRAQFVVTSVANAP